MIPARGPVVFVVRTLPGGRPPDGLSAVLVSTSPETRSQGRSQSEIMSDQNGWTGGRQVRLFKGSLLTALGVAALVAFS